MTMGLRKFQEMVFTGRPFTADEMYDCDFVNSVVPRDQLEAEVEKYALACARNRPVDTVFQQKMFFEIMKQFQGEYMGSLLSAVFESMGGDGPTRRETTCMLGDAIDAGLADAVKDNDSEVPARVPAEQVEPQEEGLTACCHSTATSSSTCPSGSPARTAPSCSPTAAPRSSKSKPPEGDPLRRWSASGAEIKPGDDGALFSFLACSKQSVVVDPDDADDVELLRGCSATADAVVWSRGIAHRWRSTSSRRTRSGRAYPHLTVTSITPFGLEGPWADRPATEFTLQAWSGGMIGLGRGAADRAPVFVGGQIGEWLAGAYAAARHDGLRARRGDSSTCRCSRRRSSCLTYYPVTFTICWAGRSATFVASPCPASRRRPTGWSALGCGTAQQWFDLCAMVGHHEWIDEDRRCPSPNRPTCTPTTRRVGARAHASTRSSTWRPRSASRTRRSATAPTSRRSTTSSSGLVRHQPARRVHAARTALPRQPVAAARTAAGAAARRAHRALPPKRTSGREAAETAHPNGRLGEIAVRGAAGPRHDDASGPGRRARTCWRCSAPR